MADTQFVSDKLLTFDCGHDLGHGNLSFVRNTPSRFALSFCEVRLNSLYQTEDGQCDFNVPPEFPSGA